MFSWRPFRRRRKPEEEPAAATSAVADDAGGPRSKGRRGKPGEEPAVAVMTAVEDDKGEPRSEEVVYKKRLSEEPPPEQEEEEELLHQRLLTAVRRRESLSVIQEIVGDNSTLLLKKSEYGWLPLHIAAYGKVKLEVVQYLSDECPESLLVKNDMGLLPLHLAVVHKTSLEVVDCLMDKCPEALIVKDNQGRLPLHFAAICKATLEVVQCLADKRAEALLVKDKEGRLPLHIAADGYYNVSLSVVQCLADKCPEALLVKNKQGWLPLHVAAAGASLEVVQCLADRCPEALLVKVNYEGLPYHIAARSDLMMLSNMKGKDRYLPVDVARRFNKERPDVVAWLAAAMRDLRRDHDRVSKERLPDAAPAPGGRDGIPNVIEHRRHEPVTVSVENVESIVKVPENVESIVKVPDLHRKDRGVVDRDAWHQLITAIKGRKSLRFIEGIVQSLPGLLRTKDSSGRLPVHHATYENAPLEVVQYLADQRPDALLVQDKDGWLPLHHAAERASLEVIRWLANMSPEALLVKQKDGWLPLHVAAEHATVEVVQYLADKNPEALLVGTTLGSLPLHFAVAYSSLEVVQCLADQCPESLLVGKADDGWLPLHVAAEVASLEVVQFVTAKCPEALLVKEKVGWLPLHVAAQFATLEVVQYLAEKCPEALLVKNKDGWLPLHLAAQFASTEVVGCLANMCPEALIVKQKGGWLPMHLASAYASSEVVRCLANMRPEAALVKQKDGLLPLHLAAMYASVKAVQCLTDKRPDALLVTDNDGQLPLHLACQDAPLHIVRCLADECPEALLVKGKKGWLPLHVAAQGASLGVVKYLSAKCPEALLITDNSGWLPLHYAVRAASVEVVQFLVDKCPEAMLVKADDLRLPLHIAAQDASLEVVQCLLEACPKAVLAKQKDGWLPLHYAASYALSDVVRCLADKAPEALLVKEEDGWLPLHFAAANGESAEVVHLLADMRPDALFEKDNRGWLPLHVAAQDAPLEVVRCLANKAPDALLVRQKEGKLPVEVARTFNRDHPDVVKWLEAARRDRQDRQPVSNERLSRAAAAPVPHQGQQHQQDYLNYPLRDISQPHPHDVLCGRGGGTNSHFGNTQWMALVQDNRRLYLTLPKKQKMLLSQSIVMSMRSQAPPGRFLKKDGKTDLWYDVGDKWATETTSQALREGASTIREGLGVDDDVPPVAPEIADLFPLEPRPPRHSRPTQSSDRECTVIDGDSLFFTMSHIDPDLLTEREPTGVGFGPVMSFVRELPNDDEEVRQGGYLRPHQPSSAAAPAPAVDYGLEAIGTSFGSMSIGVDSIAPVATYNQATTPARFETQPTFLQQAVSRGNLLECSDTDEEEVSSHRQNSYMEGGGGAGGSGSSDIRRSHPLERSTHPTPAMADLVSPTIKLISDCIDEYTDFCAFKDECVAFRQSLCNVKEVLEDVQKEITEGAGSGNTRLRRPMELLQAAIAEGGEVLRKCSAKRTLLAFVFSKQLMGMLNKAKADIEEAMRLLQVSSVRIQVSTRRVMDCVSDQLVELHKQINASYTSKHEVADLIRTELLQHRESQGESLAAAASDALVKMGVVNSAQDCADQFRELQREADSIRKAKVIYDEEMLEAVNALTAPPPLPGFELPQRQGSETSSAVQECMICPVSGDIMRDPVTVLESGITYDRECLCASLLLYPDLDPGTGQRFGRPLHYAPNIDVRNLIMAQYGDSYYKRHYDGEFKVQYDIKWKELRRQSLVNL